MRSLSVPNNLAVLKVDLANFQEGGNPEGALESVRASSVLNLDDMNHHYAWVSAENTTMSKKKATQSFGRNDGGQRFGNEEKSAYLEDESSTEEHDDVLPWAAESDVSSSASDEDSLHSPLRQQQVIAGNVIAQLAGLVLDSKALKAETGRSLSYLSVHDPRRHDKQDLRADHDSSPLSSVSESSQFIISPNRRSIFTKSEHAANPATHTTCRVIVVPVIPRQAKTPFSSPSLPRKPSLKSVSSIGNVIGLDGDDEERKRTVSFGQLETREFNIALSDHPSVSYGPAVQLGWDYQDAPSVALDDYELHREPRRNTSQLVLSDNVRRFLLLKRAGYSKHEVRQAMMEVDRVKRGRLLTDLFLPVRKLDESMEDVLDRIKEFFGKREETIPS